MKNIQILVIVIIIGILTFTHTSFARTFVTIGTADVTGVYYPTGGAIAKKVNKKSDHYGLKVFVESTQGSAYNVNAVMSGNLEFGLVQSDRQYQAVNGLAEWGKSGPQKKLRSVFSIHSESITIVVTKDSGVLKVEDLKGKRVNIGNKGSGQLQNSKDVLEAFGILNKIKAMNIKSVDAPGLIQDRELDAFFYTVGHPNGNIKEGTSGRIKVKILPIEGPTVDKLIEKYPYYTKSIINMKDYPNAINSKAGKIPSIGVVATLVTSSEVSTEIVYAVTKEVFENFESFKKLHPAYSVLTKKSMLQGMTAPLHLGAIKYYKESGLIKFVNKDLFKQ